MYIEILLIWILIFVVFLVINITANSYDFGRIAGIWILLLGLFVIVGGVQMETGITITDTVSGSNIVYDYSDITLPYSTYSFIWGLIFILLGLYILYSNLL